MEKYVSHQQVAAAQETEENIVLEHVLNMISIHTI